MSRPETGSAGRHRHVVTHADTATALGSGGVPVLATPRLLAWMEAATVTAVAEQLEDDETTVGTRVELDHVAASTVGAQVVVRAELVTAQGREVVFAVAADDDSGRHLGSGRITRVVVDRSRFLGALP